MSEVRSIQGLLLLALALAVTTWYFVRLGIEESSSKPVSFTYPYTIQYAVPDDFVVLEATETVQITIQGRESVVERFNPFLVRVKVDILDERVDVQQVELTEDYVTLPEGLEVTAFEPAIVTFRLDALRTQLMSVIAQPTGEPAAGAIVKSMTTTPPLVNVRGPETELSKYERIYTQPIDLTNHAIDFEERAALVVPSPLSLPDGNPTVLVRVELEIPGTEGGADGEREEAR